MSLTVLNTALSIFSTVFTSTKHYVHVQKLITNVIKIKSSEHFCDTSILSGNRTVSSN